MKSKSILSVAMAIAMLIGIIPDGQAQRRKNKSASTLSYDKELYAGMEWRSIGPFRGGRAAAVAGVPGDPNLFYFGASGGGVWKTEDAGQTWKSISDGYFGGSIGAIAVSEYDPNVIYVGGGEKTVRGNVSAGHGMWKSVDGGKTWEQIGLEKSRQIGRIRIHPRNPDLVYAAVMGDLFKETDERGVYRSEDGGETWEKILTSGDQLAGAFDLSMDANNPRVLYASTWHIQRTPYSLISGGEGSALWKSTDGGDNWTNISGNKGMPEGTLGIIGVSVSPANSELVYAIIEAEEGGVFKSTDAGKTWNRVNDDRSLRQRAWYYSNIIADPQREDVVYVMNVSYGKSTDGGKSFELKRAPHGDHHALWIDPTEPDRMIIGDDGGAQVSKDGGDNWTTYHNQPTAQFYRVITDNSFPYRIYGAQQDNSTVRIAHRTDGNAITERDWEPTAGGESAHLAIDPENNDVVYGGSYGGYLTRVNHATGQERAINVWPDNPMGYGAEGMKYRFQWNFPIFFSPHNPDKLYTASNHLHVSYDEGQSWELISPDLTRNDPGKLKPSGGPITKDNTGVEYYCTIFAATESPYEEGLLWTGSDDGLVHISKNGGETWENVTPGDMPEWMMINNIEVDPFTKGGAYIAGTRYKMGDYTPYLYKTKDYGQTWTRINTGISDEHFTRVVRADPERQGLLYAGTESGMYISFDEGTSWQEFQMNLPQVPITDLTVKENNLIAATQGRSFWMIDDLTPLHQLDKSVASSNFHLFSPKDSYRMMGGGRGGRNEKLEGENHPKGVMFHYYMPEEPGDDLTASLELMETDGSLIKMFSTEVEDDNNDTSMEKLELQKGFNRFVWDMRYPDATDFEGMILWAANTNGPMATPGNYKAKMTVNGESKEVNFKIVADPRATATAADYQAQFNFLMECRDKLTETHDAIKEIRSVREQINMVSEKIKKEENMEDLVEKAKSINDQITKIEKELYQTNNKSRQDPLNYPIKLNNKLAHVARLVGGSNFKPTDQAVDFKEEVTSQIDEQLEMLNEVINSEVPDFNKMVKQKSINAVMLDDQPVTTP